MTYKEGDTLKAMADYYSVCGNYRWITTGMMYTVVLGGVKDIPCVKLDGDHGTIQISSLERTHDGILFSHTGVDIRYDYAMGII